MLLNSEMFKGRELAAEDDSLGTVKDLFFDDASWTVRYLVADTRRWLPGRRVLIAPEALKTPTWQRDAMPVALTRAQIEQSPVLAEHQPVSRQNEVALARFFNWIPYWQDAPPPHRFVEWETSTEVREEVQDGALPRDGDPHLRSLNEVEGYRLTSEAGTALGPVEGVLLDGATWNIEYFVIGAAAWLADERHLLPVAWVRTVDWARHAVSVPLPADLIREGPAYDPDRPLDGEFERRLRQHFESARAAAAARQGDPPC